MYILVRSCSQAGWIDTTCKAGIKENTVKMFVVIFLIYTYITVHDVHKVGYIYEEIAYNNLFQMSHGQYRHIILLQNYTV